MHNQIFKVNLYGLNFVFFGMPGSNLFHFEIKNKKGANIERVLPFFSRENVSNIKYFGASHLIEHLSFKTSKDYSGEDLLNELKKIGVYNAHTSYDEIAYYLTSIIDKKDKVINLLCNIAFNDLKKIDVKKEFKPEKDTVINEARQYLDDPQTMFSMNLDVNFFNHNPLDNVISSPENIAALSLDDCIYLKNFFLNKRDHVFFIGYDSDVLDYKDIALAVKKEVDRFELEDEMNHNLESIYFKNFSEFSYLKKTVENDSDQFIIACLINNVGDDFYKSTLVNSYIQGKSKHSLSDYIREKEGLTYNVTFETILKDGKPYTLFSCDCNPEDQERILPLFKKSIKKCADCFSIEDFNNFIDSCLIEFTVEYTDVKKYFTYAEESYDIAEFDEYFYNVNAQDGVKNIIKSISFEYMKKYLKNISRLVSAGDYSIVKTS